MNDEMQIAKELTLAVLDKLNVPNSKKANSQLEKREESNKILALEVNKLYTEIYKGVIAARDSSGEEIKS
ncbi:hypothetical protein BK784_26970 [Bacillus thuringiensis serovar medellin]|uniref:Uncharacterized protein n=1 Tax=Bacillus thuringiensis subsp. medellin TaxID=79672 RepID=A0A9X6MTI2_BACTV|nr:hypothetical protein [Bacillus thuringiensis]MEC5308920.1 hypothetical protein [Bacillus thuringiensis]OUB89289.1 hypothetical protein BK784_26970 [Bacillus thuringiensis serovar medellin]